MSEELKSSEPPDPLLGQLTPSEVDALEALRRTPQPYHRHQADLRSPELSSESSSNALNQTPLALSEENDRAISDEDERARRKLSRSPSDSGTEADDEGYSFVRALPAPPIKPRKGLRDIRGSGRGDASPLLTPSQVDEEGRRLSASYFKPSKEGLGDRSAIDDEARAARERYLKRRRAEMVRRTTEVALLGCTGLLVVHGCSCWQKIIRWHRVEITTHGMVVMGLLALYPVRLLRYSRSRGQSSKKALQERVLSIPAAFDPATILYPIFIPILISISLLPTFEKLLLPNIILSLSALPVRLIPGEGTRLPGESSENGLCALHWIIASIPLIASQNTEWPSKLYAPLPYMLKSPPPEGLDTETLVTLFALHQALLPPLHYLTTTSLLPAELHLLSIGLINIFLFAESPQMVILGTLLWVGGLGLFVFCGRVLKWGVALARIPRWRFRRAGHIVKARQSFLQILNDSIGSRRSKELSDSDADEDVSHLKRPPTKNGGLKLNIKDATKNGFLFNQSQETMSAVEKPHKSRFPDQENIDGFMTPARRRRYTLPNLQDHEPEPQSSIHRRKRSKASHAQSFLSLTPTQATLRKWFYAGYVYLNMVVLVLGPIRIMIEKYALHGFEPFGWAIGYLFGNIQSLRFWVVKWDLEEWIALPAMHDPIEKQLELGRIGFAESIRHFTFGKANTRLLLCGYCLSVILMGLVVVLQLTSIVEVDTRRKVFHGMMVAMLLPTIYIDPGFVALALALVLAIFLLLDLLRASQLPPLSRPLAQFLTPYVDGRDLRGPVVISHIFLLIGCAIPLWLSLAGIPRTGTKPWEDWEVESRDISMVAGVVCVGMGDAAASLIGRRFGRRKWPWAGGKSLEGSLAFAIAVTSGLLFGKAWLRLGQWEAQDNGQARDDWIVTVIKAALSAAGASLNEAVLTGGNDNVIVPVFLWLLVRGVRL